MKKNILSVILLSIALALVGCSNSGSTSSSAGGVELSRGENTITTESGGLIYVVHDNRVSAGEVVRVKYAVRNAEGEPLPGTLHWQDNTDDRVWGDGLIRHIYRAEGVYRLAIQPDGEEKVVVGTVVVSAAPDPIPEAEATSAGGGGPVVCPPLTIPGFAFPALPPVPASFHIDNTGTCPEFVDGPSDAGTEIVFVTVPPPAPVFVLHIFPNSPVDAAGIAMTCFAGAVCIPGADVMVPDVQFASDNGLFCTGNIHMVGDPAGVITSQQIDISCM